MPFDKGKTGNPNGRPKGAQNKANSQLRDTIGAFLDENFEKVKEDFEKLPPRDRTRLYCDLLQYSVPKLQSVSLTPNFEDLSDEQLDYIIDNLKKQVR